MTNEDAIMTNEDAIRVIKMMIPLPRRGDGKSTTHLLQTLAISMAIDALQERKTGKWINAHSTCSICNWYSTNRYGFIEDANYNYCPNCGAKMEGDE